MGRSFVQSFWLLLESGGLDTSLDLEPQAQCNGCAEAAVKIARTKLIKSSDPYRAPMAYRATPLDNGCSPAELLFSRRLRIHVPLSAQLLISSAPDAAQLKTSKHEARECQESDYNKRHAVSDRPELQPTQKV